MRIIFFQKYELRFIFLVYNFKYGRVFFFKNRYSDYIPHSIYFFFDNRPRSPLFFLGFLRSATHIYKVSDHSDLAFIEYLILTDTHTDRQTDRQTDRHTDTRTLRLRFF